MTAVVSKSINKAHNPIQNKKFFTTRVATGQVFCGRLAERKRIAQCINNNEHMVVFAPRRYGKTSLIVKALDDSALPYAMIDLFCSAYQEDVARKLAKGVSQVAQQLMGSIDKTWAKIEDFFQGVFESASIGFKAGGVDISLDFSAKRSAIEYIEDLLQGLEKIAHNAQSKAILFIDEFQDILKIEKTEQIQAAIRAVAQHSTYITYIFSGSSRVMLEEIFNHANQPLYMMCHKIVLHRIDQDVLFSHIEEASISIWGRSMGGEVINYILQLTECHTYYFNALCSDLMGEEESPTVERVDQIWLELLETEKAKIIAQLQELNSNRRKILVNIALLNEVSAPNSQAFLQLVKLPVSSTQVAIKYLLNHDYLYETEKGHLKLVDPLLKRFIVDRHLGC